MNISTTYERVNTGSAIEYPMSAREAAKALGRHRIAGSGYLASCPVPGHGQKRGDIDPSLSLTDGEGGKLLYHCKGNCDHRDVREALIDKGVLVRRDGVPAPRRQPSPAKAQKPVKTEKPADDDEPVNLDTAGAPDLTPEQVLVNARILDRNQDGGYTIPERDADRKIIARHKVTAIKPFVVHTSDGRPALIDVRIEFGWQDDKGRPNKEIRPVSLWRNTKTGALEWKAKQWPKGRRQVYGQHLVSPGDTVVIHEGPPKAKIGNELLEQYRHVAWCGGACMVAHHDWSFLAGCVVVGFPDNDTPGIDAMTKMRDLAKKAGARCFGAVEWPEGAPAGAGLDDLIGEEAGLDDADLFIAEAIARSVETKRVPTAAECDLDGFELHEDGIALAFAKKFKDNLLYDHTRGSWYNWTGSHWKIEQTNLAFAWSRDICRELARDEEMKIKAAVSKAATASAVERFARSDRSFAVTSEKWNTDPYLLGTPDGVVDLRTGHIRPASPSDMITKVTAVGPAPVGTRAPTWERFLHEATNGDLELQRFLAQIAGYCLTGDVSEECLFFVHGQGGNGKGVFIKAIGTILGDYSVSTAIQTFTASKNERHPTELAALAGARMVTASETEDGRSWAEARIKELTGNESPISARFMRQDFFEFMPTFKIVIFGNHRPILNNVDDANRRRFNIIPFTHKPKTVDSKLKNKIEKEYPAILRWMIDGCLDWQANGLVRPTSVLEATQEYFDSQDVFGQWIKQCCAVEPGNKELWTVSADLYESWVQYCAGHGEEPGKERDLGSKLTKLECGKTTKRIQGIVTAARTGICLREYIQSDQGDSDHQA
jgi:P4 family phage/plasmid primase-like protien